MAFPVEGIDRLDEGAELVEIVQFADSCDFILDATGKSVVELMAEGGIAPIDFGGKLLKADNVFSNFLIITHFELFKLIFHIGFNIKRSEVGLEFGDKFVVVVGPDGVGMRVHEQWFEVVKCCSFEEGQCIVDLVRVELKCIGSVAEVELQLN